MQLFHVSDNSHIRRFEPRPPPSAQAGVEGDAVWAIDGDHLPHYLLPRDCPRVTLRRGPKTTEQDCQKFFKEGIEKVIAIEMAWYERVRAAELFVYDLPLDTFTLVDSIAGYYISRQIVEPLGVTPITNLIEKIVEFGYKLRVLGNLWELHDEVVASTIQYSIIRMRNALPRE